MIWASITLLYYESTYLLSIKISSPPAVVTKNLFFSGGGGGSGVWGGVILFYILYIYSYLFYIYIILAIIMSLYTIIFSTTKIRTYYTLLYMMHLDLVYRSSAGGVWVYLTCVKKTPNIYYYLHPICIIKRRKGCLAPPTTQGGVRASQAQ